MKITREQLRALIQEDGGFRPNTSKATNAPKDALKVLNSDGFNWRPSAVRYASAGMANGWLLVNDETQEAFVVYPEQGDYEDTDYARAVEQVEKAEAEGNGGRIGVAAVKNESIDVELQKKGLRQALPNERGHHVDVVDKGKTIRVWATQDGNPGTRDDVKHGKLRRDVTEEANDDVVTERAEDVSDHLNKLIGFATVFANIPRNIRLDVQRMVTGENEDKIDVKNLEKVVHVLGELDPELDDKFLSFFEKQGEPVGEASYVDEVAPPGGEKVVKALKKNKDVDNPFAVAWSMKNKGDRFKK